MPAPDPFDCQEFHELCMDYRGAVHPIGAQQCYERLQTYCRRVAGNAGSDGYNEGYGDGLDVSAD